MECLYGKFWEILEEKILFMEEFHLVDETSCASTTNRCRYWGFEMKWRFKPFIGSQ